MRMVAGIVFLLLSCLIGQAQILPYSGSHGGYATAKSLINVSGSTQGQEGEFAFLNLVKSMGILSSSGGYAFPGVLNVNNVPASAIATTTSNTIPLPSNYSGNFVAGFGGTVGGTGISFGIGTAITVVSDPQSCVSGSTGSSLTLIGTNCVVTVNWGQKTLTTLSFIGSSTYSGFTAPYLVRSDQLAAYTANVAAGQSWGGMNPDWIARMQLLNPRIIRMMDFSGITVPGNVADCCNVYANRTPVDSLSYYAAYWSPSNWVGTASGTNTYTVNSGRTGAYVNGEMLQAQFTNANTSTTPTINDNGRGAVTLVSYAAQALFMNSIPANGLMTLQYDGTLNKFLIGLNGIRPNVPLEVQVAACNSIPTDCGINIPWLMDSNTDITTIATYVANNLDPAHTAYFEWGNEVWNFGNNQTNWAEARGAALGFPTATCSVSQQIYDYYALRHSQTMALITSAWASAGRSASQLKRVLAWQAFGASGANGCTQSYRFNGTDLSAYGFNTSPNRPIDSTHTDIGSYAAYFSGSQAPGTQSKYISNGLGFITNLLSWADLYATGTPANIATALAGFDADVRSSSGEDLNTLNTTIYPAWNTLMVGYGLQVFNYEGGFEGTYPTTATCTTLGMTTMQNTTYCDVAGEINALILGYQNSYYFISTPQLQWTQFMAQSQSFAPAWFELFPYNQWSAFSGDMYSAPFQVWYMMINWNS